MSAPDLQAAIATVEYSRQTHVEWASFLRRNPGHDPGAVGDVEYHEQCVREYDNVLAVLRQPERARWIMPNVVEANEDELVLIEIED